MFKVLRDKGSDVNFIQEAHITPEIVQLWRNEWGSEIYYSSGESNARGVMIPFNNKFKSKVKKQINDKNGCYLILLIQD